MKDLGLLAWLTQLGLSVAFPLAGYVLLAVWLRNQFGWGSWVIVVGLILGLVSAAQGFMYSLRAMTLLSSSKKKEDKPPVAFNDHD